MKIKCMPIRCFEKDDFVRTMEGAAKVVMVKDRYHPVLGYFERQEVYLKHKFAYSANAGNNLVWIDAEEILLINKKEYDEEVDLNG